MRISGKIQAAIFPVERPLFYYITDRSQRTNLSLLSCIKRAVSWGVDFIQIREKDLSDLKLYELTRAVVSLARGTHCRVLVNGRADLARAAGAHGVHLPSKGLQISDLHPSLTRDMLVGASTHSLREARRAAAQGAHYVLLGPVYAVPSKLHYGPALGLKEFGRICRAVHVPVIGLGGIRADNYRPVLDAGAAGIAGISLFQQQLARFPAWGCTMTSC